MPLSNHSVPLWWAVKGQLAGMPLPFLDPERRENLGGALDAYEDELRPLWKAGIRTVISLLNIHSDTRIYETAGFCHICVPIPDGGIPSQNDVETLISYYDDCPRAVAIHCAAGLGRTGTVIAMLLINSGRTLEEAVHITRTAQPAAIETSKQMRFLQQFADQS